jgi:hypothetical protein
VGAWLLAFNVQCSAFNGGERQGMTFSHFCNLLQLRKESTFDAAERRTLNVERLSQVESAEVMEIGWD